MCEAPLNNDLSAPNDPLSVAFKKIAQRIGAEKTAKPFHDVGHTYSALETLEKLDTTQTNALAIVCSKTNDDRRADSHYFKVPLADFMKAGICSEALTQLCNQLSASFGHEVKYVAVHRTMRSAGVVFGPQTPAPDTPQCM